MEQATRSIEGCPDGATQDSRQAAGCKKCGKELRSDNRSGWCYKCKSYERLTPYAKQQNIERSRKNSTAFRAKIDAIKLERGCVDCGYNCYAEALDFDHLPGVEKTKNIALMWGWAWEKVLAEIAKCEVVCSNCHRHRTKVRVDSAKAERATGTAVKKVVLEPAERTSAACGTSSGYSRHLRLGETPCADCRAAQAAKQRRIRAAAKERAAKANEIGIG